MNNRTLKLIHTNKRIYPGHIQPYKLYHMARQYSKIFHLWASDRKAMNPLT